MGAGGDFGCPQPGDRTWLGSSCCCTRRLIPTILLKIRCYLIIKPPGTASGPHPAHVWVSPDSFPSTSPLSLEIPRKTRNPFFFCLDTGTGSHVQGRTPETPPSTPIPTARHPLRGRFRAAAINYGKSPRMPSGSCWKLKRNRIYVPINRYLHTQPYCTANSPTGAWGKPHEAGPRRFAGQDWRQSRKHRAGELSCGG